MCVCVCAHAVCGFVRRFLLRAALATNGQGATRGCLDCMAHTGVAMLRGIGGAVDEARGVGWLLEAAELGHAGSQVRIGQLLATGVSILGIESAMAGPTHAGADPLQWFAEAANRGGSDEALFELALRLKDVGRGAVAAAPEASAKGDRYDTAAFSDWQEYMGAAAQRGWAPAMAFVGLRLLTGVRWPRQDVAAGLKALQVSALHSQRPQVAARTALGILQLRGAFGLAHNEVSAVALSARRVRVGRLVGRLCDT